MFSISRKDSSRRDLAKRGSAGDASSAHHPAPQKPPQSVDVAKAPQRLPPVFSHPDALFESLRHRYFRTFRRSRRDLAIRAVRHPEGEVERERGGREGAKAGDTTPEIIPCRLFTPRVKGQALVATWSETIFVEGSRKFSKPIGIFLAYRDIRSLPGYS